jgi:hypothetical protein
MPSHFGCRMIFASICIIFRRSSFLRGLNYYLCLEEMTSMLLQYSMKLKSSMLEAPSYMDYKLYWNLYFITGAAISELWPALSCLSSHIIHHVLKPPGSVNCFSSTPLSFQLCPSSIPFSSSTEQGGIFNTSLIKGDN